MEPQMKAEGAEGNEVWAELENATTKEDLLDAGRKAVALSCRTPPRSTSQIGFTIALLLPALVGLFALLPDMPLIGRGFVLAIAVGSALVGSSFGELARRQELLAGQLLARVYPTLASLLGRENAAVRWWSQRASSVEEKLGEYSDACQSLLMDHLWSEMQPESHDWPGRPHADVIREIAPELARLAGEERLRRKRQGTLVLMEGSILSGRFAGREPVSAKGGEQA